MLDHRPIPHESQTCPRRRMLAAVIGGGGLAAILIAGIVMGLAKMTPLATAPHTPRTGTGTAAPHSASPQPVSPDVARARDELAARPMPDTGTGDAYGRPDLS